MKRLLVSAVGVLVCVALSAQAPTRLPGENPSGPQLPHVWVEAGPPLYDNGAADGVNGYSNGTAAAIGARRAVLDNFVVPPAEMWSVTGFGWTHVWGTPTTTIPAGTGDEFQIVGDVAGMPDLGTVLGVANVTMYTETATGNIFFSRPEAASFTEFDPIVLPAGTYWFEHLILGPENNFHLTSPLVGTECWVNYDDLGGLQSCTAQFGVASDINFALFGSVVIPAELIEYEVD